MTGTTLGAYRILEPLGAGGMGEVYRARDSKLDRDVAIKVLPNDVAADPDRLARFGREAKLLAQLNHPNIAAVYDLDDEGGTRFIAMELVEGKTLAEQPKAEGRLDIDEALDVARQIAEALEAAHESGVIHRDLKPANVKITPAGKVKVLDFGLAKALAPGGAVGLAADDLSDSPTIAAATRAGVIMGTAAYMSPEQARGKPLDRRTDIWALGCVLYEMLTGERAFQGETITDVLAAVVKEEPDWSALPDGATPDLLRLLKWSLAKNPDHRLRAAGDAAIWLEAIAAEEPRRDATVGESLSARCISYALAIPFALALLAAGAAIAWLAGLAGSSGEGTDVPATRSEWIHRPLTATGDAWNVAISPSGDMVTYLTADGLMARDTGGGDPVLLVEDAVWATGFGTGTSQVLRAGEPQWLADGSSVAYAQIIGADRMGLFAAPRLGGEPQPLASVAFDAGEPVAMFQPLAGGEILLARVLENVASMPWLRFLNEDGWQGVELPADYIDLWDAVASPDGQWVAYIAERADRSTVIGTVSRDGQQHNVLVEGGSELSKWSELSTAPQWVNNRIMRWPPGDRVYYREHSSRGMDVRALRIDLATGRARGPSELVVEGLPEGSTFDVADGGRRVAYSDGVLRTQVKLYRFDAARGGPPTEVVTLTSGTARHVAPRISPDGRRLAYIRKTPGAHEVYTIPTSGGEPERLQVLRTWDQLVFLDWSPDGQALAVFALGNNGAEIFIVSFDDPQPRVLRTDSVRGTWLDWSPDGKWIVYGHAGQDDENFMLYDVDADAPRELELGQRGEKIQALFSVDGSALLVNSADISEGGHYAVGTEGGPPQRLTELFARTYALHWSVGGPAYFLAEDGTVFEVAVPGADERPFAQIPERQVWEGWGDLRIDGDDMYIALAVQEPRESNVWIADLVEGDGR